MPSIKMFSFARFARLSLLTAMLGGWLVLPAPADSIDGTIAKIDENSNTLIMSNGKSYKLPGEFDYSGFRPGQKVTVFYDTDPSGSYVTDVEVDGAKAADTETPADDNEGDGIKGEQGNPNADTAAPDKEKLPAGAMEQSSTGTKIPADK